MVLGPCNLCSNWSSDFDFNRRFGCKIFYSLCDWRCDVTTPSLTAHCRALVTNFNFVFSQGLFFHPVDCYKQIKYRGEIWPESTFKGVFPTISCDIIHNLREKKRIAELWQNVKVCFFLKNKNSIFQKTFLKTNIWKKNIFTFFCEIILKKLE